MDNAVILSACRMPIGSSGGVFKDLGVIELNEAFAAQSLAVVRELELDTMGTAMMVEVPRPDPGQPL